MYDQFAFTLRFFTRLPVPGGKNHDGDLTKTAIWFPAAGLAIGLLTGLTWLLAGAALPANVAAGLAIGFGILVTGGLHEDGLADCADGLGGSHDRQRALEIMRDSRVGTYGAIALIFSIGLRWTALAMLGMWGGFLALMIAHAVSRATITLPMALSGYARESGLGSSVASGVNKNTFLAILAVSFTIALLLGGFAGLLSAGLAFGASWLFTQYLQTRLGGYTGDGLGAIQQVSEILILITFAVFWV